MQNSNEGAVSLLDVCVNRIGDAMVSGLVSSAVVPEFEPRSD